MAKTANGNSGKSRLRAILISAIAVAVAVALTLTLLFTFLPKKPVIDAAFKPKALGVTTADEYALKTYDSNDLDDVQVTLRADTMLVTKRGLKRAEPKLMSDTYSIETGGYKQSINFTQYPGANQTINAAMFIGEAKRVGAEKGITDEAEALTKYFAYYKYMLLSQHRNMLTSVTARSANGSLSQENLYKHPGADLQYGAVTGTDNAVEKEITLDPTYRSYHVSGLYVPAGEAVTVKVEGLAKGEKLSMVLALHDTMGYSGNVSGDKVKAAVAAAGGTPTGDYFKDADFVSAAGKFYDTFDTVSGDTTTYSTPLLSGQYNRQNGRAPLLSTVFAFTENKTYTIGSPMGGILHIGMENCYSAAKVIVTGAVETPHYILGVTTPEYFDSYLRNAPGVYSAIDTENGQLIGPAVYVRDIALADIDRLALLWHSCFAINETFSGGSYNRNNRVYFDIHVPAGAAVALGGMVFACPPYMYAEAVNYRSFVQNGSWGTLHEIGHSHASSFGSVWGLNGNMEGEVRNNALIALCYLKFFDLGSTIQENGNISGEHGFVAHAYTSLRQSLNVWQGKSDFNDFEYFGALSNYTNIMHAFGVNKFYELLYSYKTTPTYIDSKIINYKRADFIYRCAVVYGMDFRHYYNDYYKTNVADSVFLDEQLAYMAALPEYEPIANLYAGGIDGVKTGGDFQVTYGSPLLLDIRGKMLSAKTFEILSVSAPEHGTLTDVGDGKYKYHFSPAYTGTFDNISVRVKQENGQIHVLKIFLRISYNGARIFSYPAATRNLAEAVELIKTATPDNTYCALGAGAPTYKDETGVMSVKKASFYYKAPLSGEVTFSLKADDQAQLSFGNDFNALEPKITLTSYQSGYADKNSFTTTVRLGELYAFEIVNLNTGGTGYALTGIKKADGSYANVSTAEIRNADFSKEQNKNLNPYVYQPPVMVSKKDNVVAGSLSTPKTDWKILSAPENLQDGRFIEEDLFDPTTGEKIGTLKTDKWNYLIDGQTATMLHTVWRGAGIKPPTDEKPDVFVIDTNKVQAFNYFAVTTRNSGDAMITKYKLEISSDNVTYTAVGSGDKLAYTNARAELKFNQLVGRYWRLSVMGTTGKNFTIVAEIDAGSSTVTQQIIPSTASKLYYSKHWQNGKTVEGATAGHMLTQKKNAKMAFRFKGTEIAFYAATGPLYGSATVTIDGKKAGEINLSSDTPKNKQLVFFREQLSNKEHTVEIVTNGKAPFNLNFAGISYGSDLINAPNVFLERALITSLIVFVVLFALLLTFVLCLVFIPAFRKLCLSNRFIAKLDTALTKKSDRDKKPPIKGTKVMDEAFSGKSAAPKKAKQTPADSKQSYNKPPAKSVGSAPSAPANTSQSKTKPPAKTPPQTGKKQ